MVDRTAPYYRVKVGIFYSKEGVKRFSSLESAIDFAIEWIEKKQPKYEVQQETNGLLTCLWSKMPRRRYKECPTVSIWKIFPK